MQFSVAYRNAMLDAGEAVIGTDAIVKFRTGAVPANCAAADTGSVIATFTLASDWAAAAASGAKAWNNLPVAVASSLTGTLGHYRIYASDGVTCHEQGTITVTGGGGDLTVDSLSVTAPQVISITGKSLTAPNA